jgi:uncharacterized membrane protein
MAEPGSARRGWRPFRRVIAVAITIMVLELHPPHDPTPAALWSLWPQFDSYVVSFGFIAIYWVDHRYPFRHLKRVDERLLWTNMGLLFMLSLIPFATAYAGQSSIAPSDGDLCDDHAG